MHNLERIYDIEDYNRVLLLLVSILDNVSKGNSFKQEIVILRNIINGRNEFVEQKINIIMQFQDYDIPSLEAIKREFKKLAGQAIMAAEVRDSGDKVSNLMAAFKRRLSKLITIRRIDSDVGDIQDAVFVRAENALMDEDVSRALKEIGNLNKDYQNFMKKVIQDMIAYKTVYKAMNEIINHIRVDTIENGVKEAS